jgi:hypothetical protein
MQSGGIWQQYLINNFPWNLCPPWFSKLVILLYCQFLLDNKGWRIWCLWILSEFSKCEWILDEWILREVQCIMKYQWMNPQIMSLHFPSNKLTLNLTDVGSKSRYQIVNLTGYLVILQSRFFSVYEFQTNIQHFMIFFEKEWINLFEALMFKCTHLKYRERKIIPSTMALCNNIKKYF